MTGTKKVFMQAFKTLSIPTLRVEAQNENIGVDCYSMRGGCLYVDNQPVQHYFSKDMFYYEKDGVQYSVFMRLNGLFADIMMKKDGVVTYLKAGSELHYNMTYGKANENTLDVVFGMGIDSQRKSYYYCGLKLNGKVVISIPADEESCKSQKILSISYDEKTGNLISNWDTSAYASAVDAKGEKVYPGFFISKISMRFDALYNTCSATLSEYLPDYNLYDDGVAKIELTATGSNRPKGSCLVTYSDKDKKQKTMKLVGIDSIVSTDESGKTQTDYFCGIEYGGKVVLPVPNSDKEKKEQRFLKVTPYRKSWSLMLADTFSAVTKKIRGENPDFYVISLNAMGGLASVLEDRGVKTEYKTTGRVVFGNELLGCAKNFRMNKEQTALLKQNCIDSEMTEEPLTLEALATIMPPTSVQEITEGGVTKQITMDGQQFCSYKTAEMMTNLAIYFTGDTHNSDSSLNFCDVYGTTKANALMQLNAVNPNIIKEIEDAENTAEGHKKGYLVDFFDTLSPIMLTNALAGQVGKEMDDGYGSEDKKTKALQKSRYYMTYTPNPETESKLDVLSNKMEYHLITSIIDKYLYLSINSKLQKFMNDKATDHTGQRPNQTAQQYWAEQLYYHCINTIVLLHASYTVNPSKVTNLIKTLGVLDSKSYDIKESINGDPLKDDSGNKFNSSYSLALYGQLSNYTVTQLTNTYRGAEDYENYFKLLEELFGKLYDKVKNGTIKLPDNLQKDLQKFLEKDREAFVDWSIFQAETIMQLMILQGNMMSAIMTYAPSASGVSKLFSCFGVLFGMMSFANIFMGWDKLTSLQKAESILSVLQAGFAIGRNFSIWKTVSVMYDTTASSQARINAYYRYQVSGGTLESLDAVSFHDGEGGFNLRESIEKTSTRYSMDMATQGEARVEFTKSLASKAFVVAEVMFQLFNIVLMGIAFVCATMDLVEMFKHKSSYSKAILALSVANTIIIGASIVLGIAQFVLGFTSFVTAAVVASFLPGLNCFLFFVILALSIAMLIMHKKPIPPITLLISEKITSKIEPLPAPPQKWIDENTPKESILLPC